MGTYTLVNAATEYPVSLDDAKDHLRETTTDNDGRINSLITVATQFAELYLGRALVTQTWDMWLDRFYDNIEIPKPPLQSVSFVKYQDLDNVTQTVATSPTTYRVDTDSNFGRVYLAYGQTWPSTYPEPKAVNIRFVAGYGGAEDVPLPIKQGILLLISQWYEFREPVLSGTIVAKIPMSAEFLMSPYRMMTL